MDWTWALEPYATGAFRWSEEMSVALWPLALAAAAALPLFWAERQPGTVARPWLIGVWLLPVYVWGAGVLLLSDRPHRWLGYWPIAVVALALAAGPSLSFVKSRWLASPRALSAAVVLVLPAAGQGVFLGLTKVPQVLVEYTPHQHLGQPQTLQARLRFAECELFSPEQTLAGDRAGVHSVAFGVDCGAFRLRHAVVVEVGDDRSDPRFPLTPGRRWRYRLDAADGKSESLDVEVSAASWRDPPLGGQEVNFGHRRLKLYGFQGRTWMMQRQAGRDRARSVAPVFAAISEHVPSDVYGYKPAAAEGPFIFLPMRWPCEGFSTPPGGVPGPDRCQARVDRTDPVVGGLALLFTGGLGLPWVMKGANAKATLVDSGEAAPP